MTSQPISGPAAGARESARNADGRFGTQQRAESPDLQLVESDPSYGGYLPDDHTQGDGFADFCGGCGDELTAQGECVACAGPFEEAFRSGTARYGLVVNGDEVVIETSAYELVGSFRPRSLGLLGQEQVAAYAQRLVEQHEQQRAGE